MSARSRNLPRRSCLSIPGSSEKMLGKGPGIPADMVFLDLEDAVAPKEKEASRAKIAAAIRGNDWGDKVLCVRVNDWSTKWTAFDIIEVVGNAGERLDEIMLPKVESAAQIVAAGFERSAVEQIVRLIRINEYKRKQSPPGPRITSRAYGRDWRYPLSNGFRETF